MLGDRAPAFMVDAPVAEHLEVLGRVAVGGRGVAERVRHAHPFQRFLGHAVDHHGRGESGRLQNGRRDIDHMVPLGTDLALGLDARRPPHDHAGARAAPVRCDLFGPLIRAVHSVGPADRIVVVGSDRAEIVQVGQQLIGGFIHVVQRRHLVELAPETTLGTGTIVAGNVDDQRVVQYIHVAQGVQKAPGVLVGMLGKPGVDFHQSRGHPPLIVRQLVPGRDALGPCGQLRLSRHNAEFFLARQRGLTQGIPALVKLAGVAVDIFLGDVVRGMGGPEGEIDKEGLVRRERVLGLHPGDGMVHQIGRQVIVRIVRRLDGRRAFEERGRPLIRLRADETVELLKALAGGPAVKRPGGADFPHGRLVHLAEGGRVVTVQAQRVGNGGGAVGTHAGVAGGGGRRLSDAAHAHRMVIASGEQCLACGGTERSCVESVVGQALGGQPRLCGHVNRAAEGAGGAEAHIIDQHNHHVGRAVRGAHELRGGILHVLGVDGRGAMLGEIRNGQDLASRRHGRLGKRLTIRQGIEADNRCTGPAQFDEITS